MLYRSATYKKKITTTTVG